MVKLVFKGDYTNLTRDLRRVDNAAYLKLLDRYGQLGVEALESTTPVRTGKTAASWSYEVVGTKGVYKLIFRNSNIQNGVPIAIILQYGHGTKHGGWVEGRDYINPAIQPIFDAILRDAWKEVSK